MLVLREDDLTSAPAQSLLALHLDGMRADTPPGGVHALDLAALQAPGVTVWTVWRDGALAGIGALKRLDARCGEIKSMRTHPDHLRQGVAAALLERIIERAKAMGMDRLSLETGRGAAFEPALKLYRRRGFEAREAFGDYEDNGFSQFFHLDL